MTRRRAGRVRVLLTGATGNWGRATLRELRRRADRVEVVALSLPTNADRRALAEFADMENLEVVHGDLTDAAAVAACVARVDVVLHVGGVVSPVADDDPALAWRVNVGSVTNIVEAVRALPDPGSVAVIGVGSVAETGSRNPPVHWGRVGDPVRVSRFDEYGQTKVAAERILVESGLPRWAWLRQTGILHPGVLHIRDPIVTHTVLGGALEWVSDEDSARLLANVCEPEVPDEFWGDIHNVGGGEGWRITNWQLQELIAEALDVRDVRRWYDRNWFATQNFHGHWFTDSDRLHDLVPFREDTLAAAAARAVAGGPTGTRLAARVPARLVKRMVMRPLAMQPRGTMYYVERDDTAAIEAYFGSRAAWEAIGDWSTFDPPDPSATPTMLDHGYDESKDPRTWDASDYVGAARFRGGALVSDDVSVGDVATPLTWTCAVGHRFEASPRLVLRAGHWCPVCVRDPGGYVAQAERNAFLAQVELDDASP